MSTSAFRRFVSNHPWLAVLGGGALLATAGVAVAVTVSQTTYSALFADITNVGTGLTVSSTSIKAVKATAAASGDSQGAAIEMAPGSGAVANRALTKANWQYQATIAESAAASVTSGTFKVELFADGTSQGALFMKQVTSDATNAENVIFRWDLGADLATGDVAYEVIVTSV